MDITSSTIKLQDICRALEVRDRYARYVLERGFIPEGVRESPGSGEHRDFGPHQAFWLGMVLKLKESGLKTPLAVQVANYADGAVRTVAQSLGWDYLFFPKGGRLETEHQYFVEVGDFQYLRLVTDACPSQKDSYMFDWHHVGKPGAPVEGVRPCVMLRLDLAQIAARLGAAFARTGRTPAAWQIPYSALR
jgi:hypothetical protein